MYLFRNDLDKPWSPTPLPATRHRNAIDVNEHRQGPAVGRERLPRGY